MRAAAVANVVAWTVTGACIPAAIVAVTGTKPLATALLGAVVLGGVPGAIAGLVANWRAARRRARRWT